MKRIGVFMSLAADDPESKVRLEAFTDELGRLGWSQERNVHIDYRFAAGRGDRFVSLARDLVALKPDVIVAVSGPIAVTVQKQTRAIPIVFTNTSDPIGEGLVASLARPGANVTGALQYEESIVGKWLGMLKEIEPQLTRAALLGNPKTTVLDYFQRAGQAAAPSLGIELTPAPVENAEADIKRVIESFAAAPNGGLVLPPDATTIAHRDLIVALAARHRLPAVYALRPFVEAGGLMSYMASQTDMFRLAATYVDHILRGGKAADLPVQSPTKYETVVNLKAAKAIGLDVPSSLLVRADKVIE